PGRSAARPRPAPDGNERASLLTEVRRHLDRGVPLLVRDLERAGGPGLIQRCRSVFGSFAALRQELGVSRPASTSQSTRALSGPLKADPARAQALVLRLRQLASEGIEARAAALVPSHADVIDEARAVFGGLSNARRAAGLPIPEVPKDVDGLVAEFRKLAAVG